MIIDMHTHCFPDPLAKKAMPMLATRSGNPCPAFDGTASGLRESVTSGGADKARCSILRQTRISRRRSTTSPSRCSATMF